MGWCTYQARELNGSAAASSRRGIPAPRHRAVTGAVYSPSLGPAARCYSRRTTVALAMTQLSLRILGGFRAHHGSGRPLAIRRKKAQALLAYLALHPGAASSRDSLTGLLWSETTAEHARHNLRQTLFALRQAITPDPFIVEGELVGLREGAVHADVAAFERGVGQGTREALREATALYRGELLEGFRVDEAPFDDWLATERQRLRELVLTELERLLALDLRARALEQAVATGLRLLALDPPPHTPPPPLIAAPLLPRPH